MYVMYEAVHAVAFPTRRVDPTSAAAEKSPRGAPASYIFKRDCSNINETGSTRPSTGEMQYDLIFVAEHR